MISAKSLSLYYRQNPVVRNITVQIPAHKITIIIGANGSGKSTLLKSFAKILQPKSGTIYLENQSIESIPHKHFAKKIAYLAQNLNTSEDICVEQLVRYGRYPHHTFFSSWKNEDERLVNEALRLTNMKPFRSQSLQTLSGGQQQRAWIAMALAQNTPYLLLDEPTTYLDLTHQVEVLSLLQKLNQETQKTIIMVLHDLNLACRYADHLIALKNGEIYQSGTPNTVVTEENIFTIFGLKSQIITDPIHKSPLCIPL